MLPALYQWRIRSRIYRNYGELKFLEAEITQSSDHSKTADYLSRLDKIEERINQMRIPLGIVATDLKSGNAVTFRLGNTGSAVRASSAVPAVFQPVRIGEREYVDGGLVAPVPVHQAREMGANFVIAVDISSDPEGNPSGDTFQILLQTFTIMGKSINTLALKEAEFVVRPPLTGFKSADFTVRRRSIEAGRAVMQAQLPQLRARIAAFESGQ